MDEEGESEFYQGHRFNPEIPCSLKRDRIILLVPGALAAAHPDRKQA